MPDEQAILEFIVKVKAEPSPETKKLLQDLKEAKNSKAEQETEDTVEEEDAAEDIPEDPTDSLKAPKTPKQPKPGKVVGEGTLDDFKNDRFFKNTQKILDKDNPASKVSDALGDINEQGLATLASFAKNPAGQVASLFQKLVTMGGPEAQVLLGAVGLAIATPEVITLLLQSLSVKGGPMNRDWRFHLQGQVNEGLTRQQIIEKQNGLDPVFLSQQIGFKPNNSAWTYSSLYSMDAYRIHRIGLADKAAGIVVD